MFRKRLAAASLIAAATFAGGVAAPLPAFAQVIDLDEEKDKGQVIDLDEEGGGKAAAEAPPVVAGEPTEGFTAAKRAFDQEKWPEAAQGMFKVVSGETGDDEGNKQIAQYHLAISLYRLKFYQASYGIFSEIADKPNHLKFNETLLWLAKLATQLPEPADIVERVGKYNDEQIDAFNNPKQRELYWQLNYLLGRYKYRNRQYEEAIRLFEKVDRTVEVLRPGAVLQGISLRAAPQVGARGPVVPAHRRARSTRASKASRTRTACATSRSSRWRARTTRRRFASTRTTRRRSTARSCQRGRQVLEQGRRRQRVLARRALRGVVGVLHGRRLRARARQHPHDRVAVLPELVLPRGGHPQGRHLLRELPVRRRRRRSSRSSRQKYEPIYDELEQGPRSASRARTRTSRSSSS